MPIEERRWRASRPIFGAFGQDLRGWWEDFIPIVAILRARNILRVIAVGNEGIATSRSPGNYADVLFVGAIDKQNRVPLFSSSQLFAGRLRLGSIKAGPG